MEFPIEKIRQLYKFMTEPKGTEKNPFESIGQQADEALSKRIGELREMAKSDSEGALDKLASASERSRLRETSSVEYWVEALASAGKDGIENVLYSMAHSSYLVAGHVTTLAEKAAITRSFKKTAPKIGRIDDSSTIHSITQSLSSILEQNPDLRPCALELINAIFSNKLAIESQMALRLLSLTADFQYAANIDAKLFSLN